MRRIAFSDMLTRSKGRRGICADNPGTIMLTAPALPTYYAGLQTFPDLILKIDSVDATSLAAILLT
jgi:hypothetical protein